MQVADAAARMRICTSDMVNQKCSMFLTLKDDASGIPT